MNIGALHSIRARLTLWYTGVLALLLIAFALAAYFTVAHTVSGRTDQALVEITGAFGDTVSGEHRESESKAMAVVVRETLGDLRFRGYRFAVYDGKHRLVAASVVRGSGKAEKLLRSLLTPSTRMVSLLVRAEQGDSDYATFFGHEHQIRAYASRLHSSAANYTLVAMHFLDQQQDMLEDLSEALFAVVPLALLLACAGGYWLARKGLAPVSAMARQAQRISAANLHERLPIVNPRDELGTLAATFNGLLARLGGAFEQQQRFMADASHELRTPVAIVRGETEVALSKPSRSEMEYRESLAIAHGESVRLTRIVEDLFLLSRADTGQLALSKSAFYLDELVQECVYTLRTLAASRQMSIICEVDGEMLFRGDENLIRRMIINLLDNAIKYSSTEGKVRVECRHRQNGYCIVVTDSGGGIPADSQPHVFERFYRADVHRGKSGAGLGLPIARWIAQAHGGQIDLVRSDSSGSLFKIRLPH